MSSYIVLLLIIVTIVILSVCILYTSRNYHFTCPNCKQIFRVSAKKILITVHAFDDYNLKCPYCGTKDYMKQIKDK